VIALVFSGLLLFNGGEGADVSKPVVIGAGLLLGGLLAFVASRAVQTRRLPARTGYEELLGQLAEVREPLDPAGQVFLEGALWQARLGDGQGPVPVGDRVRVEAVDGLTLVVSPVRAGRAASEEGAS
jgi:membrane-bound serine protease (ClpP class)